MVPLWFYHYLITWKSAPPSPPPSLCALPSHINMITMIRQNTEFPPTARFPRQTYDHQALHCPTANFWPLSRGKVYNTPHLNHCVCYLFDPKVTGALGLSQDPSHSEFSVLTHFSMSLVRKYVNLKETYNQDIKE